MKDYLGDGVYVEYDGFHFKLMANDHINPSDTIYLEHGVLAALNRFAERTSEVSNA